MKKDKHFRILLGAGLCYLFGILIWWHAEWSAIQIGCFAVMLVCGIALLVNNQRNEAFHNFAATPYVWPQSSTFGRIGWI